MTSLPKVFEIKHKSTIKEPRCRAFALSPKGDRIATVTADGRIRLSSTETGAPLGALGFTGKCSTNITWTESDHICWGMGDGRLLLWDTQTNKLARTIRLSWRDSRKATSFRQFDHSGRPLGRSLDATNDKDFLICVSATRDGRNIAAATHDGWVHVYTHADAKPRRVHVGPTPPNALAWSPTQSHLLLRTCSDTSVFSVDTERLSHRAIQESPLAITWGKVYSLESLPLGSRPRESQGSSSLASRFAFVVRLSSGL